MIPCGTDKYCDTRQCCKGQNGDQDNYCCPYSSQCGIGGVAQCIDKETFIPSLPQQKQQIQNKAQDLDQNQGQNQQAQDQLRQRLDQNQGQNQQTQDQQRQRLDQNQGQNQQAQDQQSQRLDQNQKQNQQTQDQQKQRLERFRQRLNQNVQNLGDQNQQDQNQQQGLSRQELLKQQARNNQQDRIIELLQSIYRLRSVRNGVCKINDNLDCFNYCMLVVNNTNVCRETDDEYGCKCDLMINRKNDQNNQQQKITSNEIQKWLDRNKGDCVIDNRMDCRVYCEYLDLGNQCRNTNRNYDCDCK